MKHSILSGLFILVLGFGIGWLVKPAPLPKPATAVAATGPRKSTAVIAPNALTETTDTARKMKRESGVSAATDMPAEDQTAILQATEILKEMFSLRRVKFEQHIELLSESLNLSPAQKAKIITWLDDSVKKFEDIKVDISDPNSMSEIEKEIWKHFTNKALEDQLASFLTNDQKAALADFKEREFRDQVDAFALKSLSHLQGIIQLEDHQRDEVYKLLSTGAEASVREESENYDMAKLLNEGLGVEVNPDPYDLRIMQAIANFTELPEAPSDREHWLKNLGETIEKRIDAKVEQLRPALNDRQLEQYRTELEGFGNIWIRNFENMKVVGE